MLRDQLDAISMQAVLAMLFLDSENNIGGAMVSEFEGVKSSVAIKFLSAISLLSEENCLKPTSRPSKPNGAR